MSTAIKYVQRPLSSLFPAIGWSAGAEGTRDAASPPDAKVIGKRWILCIDDDQEFSHGLKLQIQTRGYEVVRAFEGMDGYRFAFEFEPAVILLDLHLPNGSGEEVLSQLRYHPSTAHIPVVVVTGLNEKGLCERMLSQGASDFFQKPVSYSLLADAADRFAAADEPPIPQE